MQKASLVTLLVVSTAPSVFPFNILVDYTYDSNNFFNTQEKKDAMQAVADRFSRIITSPLLALDATYRGGNTDWRIGFIHPGTGASFQISTAANAGSDALNLPNVPAPDVYAPGFTLPANTWILYAGGRAGLGSAGLGGTGTGVNFGSVFDDPSGPMHRGAIPNTPGSTTGNDLPAWGGTVSFDSGVPWHFGLATAATPGTTDFYSIALHEVGHALGLATTWNQWHATGDVYGGLHGVLACNTDNGTTRSGLREQGPGNAHWLAGAYDSFIFALAAPNLVGTVGLTTKQDLLMEPIAIFGNPTPLRFEVTNVDVGALRDIGWQVVAPEPSAALLGALGAGWLGVWRRRRAG